MYETIEAIYDNGKITPLHDKLHVKKAKVLLTILEEMDGPEEEGMRLEELINFKGALKKFPEGMAYQESLRNEW
ncbi:MAG: hypothetical protein ACM3SY_15760 [Candidatus Omnitrophota bacterium]